MNMVEKTGKTVEDAVKAALAVLGVSRDQVDVEVLEESKSSILGLFGGRDAKVRVTVKEVPAEEPSVPEPVAEIPEEKPEPAKGEVPEEPVQETKAPADRDAERQAVAAAAKTFLEEVFRAMGMDLLIEKFISRKDEEIILKIHGDGIGVLIGKHGQTLDALQYLTNLTTNQGETTRHFIMLDVENYRHRREETLKQLAIRLANRVKKNGDRVVLEPMNGYERKIIHVTLQNDPQVRTESEGQDPYRHVVIYYQE